METSQSQPSLATDNFSFRWLPHSPTPSTDFNGDFLHMKMISKQPTTSPLMSQSLALMITQLHSLLPKLISSSPMTSSCLVQPTMAALQIRFIRRRFLCGNSWHKYLGFLFPSCPRAAAGATRRRSRRVDDLNRRTKEVKSLTTTPHQMVSPRMSTLPLLIRRVIMRAQSMRTSFIVRVQEVFGCTNVLVAINFPLPHNQTTTQGQ